MACGEGRTSPGGQRGELQVVLQVGQGGPGTQARAEVEVRVKAGEILLKLSTREVLLKFASTGEVSLKTAVKLSVQSGSSSKSRKARLRLTYITHHVFKVPRIFLFKSEFQPYLCHIFLLTLTGTSRGSLPRAEG